MRPIRRESKGRATTEHAVSLRERTDGFAKRLARNGTQIEAGASHAGTLLHDGHPLSELGCLNRSALTGRTTADTQQIKIVACAHEGDLLSSGRTAARLAMFAAPPSVPCLVMPSVGSYRFSW